MIGRRELESENTKFFAAQAEAGLTSDAQRGGLALNVRSQSGTISVSAALSNSDRAAIQVCSRYLCVCDAS